MVTAVIMAAAAAAIAAVTRAGAQGTAVAMAAPVREAVQEPAGTKAVPAAVQESAGTKAVPAAVQESAEIKAVQQEPAAIREPSGTAAAREKALLLVRARAVPLGQAKAPVEPAKAARVKVPSVMAVPSETMALAE